MIEVRVPDEQEGTKAVVRAWLKEVGDTVALNDPLVELETYKVTQEVPSPWAGVLSEILLETDAEAGLGRCWGGSSQRVLGPRPGPSRRSLKRVPALLDPDLRRLTLSRWRVSPRP